MKHFNIMAKINTHTGLKYVICDSASSNQGKTMALADVANTLMSDPAFITLAQHPLKPRKRGRDIWVVLQEISTQKIILIQSGGDIASVYRRTWEYLAKGHVDIIVLASHNYGVTRAIVQQIARKYNYTELYFSNFRPKDRFSWLPAFNSIVSQINKKMIIDLALNL